MNINGYNPGYSSALHSEGVYPLRQGAGPGTRTFGEAIVVPLSEDPERFLGCYGDGYGQQVLAEYTEDSTQEDPIVRLRGKSFTGDFDYTVHLNEIDPSHAAVPELYALWRHEKTDTGEGTFFLPPGVGDACSFQERYGLTGMVGRYAGTCRAQGYLSYALSAEGLLRFYQKFMEKRAQEQYDGYLDALLDAVVEPEITTEQWLALIGS